MPATEPQAQSAQRGSTLRGLSLHGSSTRGPSMRELLASCAAADAISTPPRAPDDLTERRREAA
ncbi:hypothetical protein FNH09_13075 [Streptomyces adustus]|uniref:Uncharacterized protein n=1 Tax=Streptomyces adustus TaxID=1609272 RepID=A0A5N8VDR5_9ACTN|nr:hypothetical protein [Streptomyces adustus]MPY32184.1 hypothetical protein [Streptomyces adustus]